MAQAQNLKNQISKQEEKKADNSPVKNIYVQLEKLKPQLEKALPKHLSADRMARIAFTTIRQNPKLMECTPESLLGAVMQAGQVGLEPDALGSAYLVPFYNGKKKVMEVQFQIGYKGLIELVRRSGQVTSIVANEVYENDEFDFEYGLEEKLYHKPTMKSDKGDLLCFYAYARFKDGGHAFTVMSVEQVNDVRDKHTKSQKNGNIFGPWKDHYESMAKKTVIKQLIKYMPISSEIQNDIVTDENVHSSFKEDPKPVYDFDESDVIDQEEAETAEK